jgi:hypothetical protein
MMSDDMVTHRLDNGLWVAWRNKVPIHGSPELLGVVFVDRSNVLVDEQGGDGTFRGRGLLGLSAPKEPRVSAAVKNRLLGGVKVSWADKEPQDGRNGNRVDFADGTWVEVGDGDSLRFAFDGEGLLVLERELPRPAASSSSLSTSVGRWASSLVNRPTRVGV